MRARNVRRLAALVAAATVASPLVVLTTSTPASADPPPTPTSVSLSAPLTTLGSQDSTTLTATTDVPVTGTGLMIHIFDTTTGALRVACDTGSTCSTSATFNNLANTSHTYRAYVGTGSNTAPPPGTVATSNSVTLTPVAWSLTLTSTLTTLGSQDSATLTAIANQSVTGTNKLIHLFDTTTGVLRTSCGTGTTCSTTTTFNNLANASHTYVAYIGTGSNTAPPPGTVATSNAVTLTPVTWSVTLTSTRTTVGSQESATLTATANQSVTGTNKLIHLFDTTTGVLRTSCGTGTTCSATTSFNNLNNTAHTYVAYIGTGSNTAPPPGTVATSNALTLTPVAWSVTLTSNLSTVGSGQTATLTATANQSVTGTGKSIHLFDTTTGVLRVACDTGTTCSTTTSFVNLNNAAHTYVAYVGNGSNTAPPPGTVATSNSLTITPVPWSVTLTSTLATLGSQESTTLTATANQSVTGTGKWIVLVDSTTNTVLWACDTGLSCQIGRSFNSLGNTAHTYRAYVAASGASAPPPGILATSNALTLTPVAWSVSLSQNGGWLDPGESFTLTATANQSVSGTGKSIEIFDVTTNTALWSCDTGTSCQIGRTAPAFPVHQYVAVVAVNGASYPPSGLVATSNVIAAPTTFDVEGSFGASSGSATALDPVNVATGNFFETRTDLTFAAAARGLAWTRTYNSRDRRVGSLGRGWSSSYTATAAITSLGNVEVRADDGRLLVFTPVTGGYASPTGFPGRLVRLADGTFRIDDYHGNTTSFGSTGAVARLDFADGTSVVVTYSNGRPATVTSSTGHALSLAYSVDGKLSSVTADDGRAVSFAYTGIDLTAVTAPDGGVRHYAYDGTHRMTSVTDPEGNVVATNTYDAMDRVVTQVTAPGQTVSFSYSDDAARTTTVTEPGATTVYTHDATGRVTQVVDPLTHTATRTYGSTGYLSGTTSRGGVAGGVSVDAHGNVLSRDLPAGDETYTYDSSDRLLTATDVRGGTTTFTYSGTGRIPATVTKPGSGTTTQTVVDGLVTATTDADGVTTTFTYDTARNLVAVTDELGHATTMTYDAAGRMTSRTTPLDETTSWTYDAAGWVTSTTDPTGAVTTWTYDLAGNLLTETDAAEHTTTYGYDAANQLASKTTADGATTTYTYDARGNLLTETAPGGATTTYTYGALGRLATETGPLGEVTSYAYDFDGRVTAVTDALGGTTSFVRDAAGNVTATTDPTGAVTTRTYDGAGRVATVTDALDDTTTYVYTSAGRLHSVERQDGATTVYGYDAAGRRTTTSDPLGHVTATAYDEDGRTASVTTAEGLVSSYTYDDAGRTLTASLPGHGTTTTTYTATGLVETRTDATGGVVTFGYDEVGRMVSATDANEHTTTYEYDARGNRIAMTDARDHEWTWTYDLSDRMTVATDPLDNDTAYTYDDLGRNVTVTDPTARVRTTTYDDAGQVTSTSYSDGSHVDYTYDDAGRVLTASDGTLTETTTYDDAGNLLTDSYGGRTIAYTYDDGGRVATVTYPDLSVATNTYDAAGRLTGVARTGGGSASYTYDDDGRVLTETLPGGVTRSYQYAGGLLASYDETRSGTTTSSALARDAAGHVSGVTTGVATTSYGYDDAGQLGSVDAPGTASDVAYVYDATGNPTSVTTGGVTTSRTYDAADRLLTSTTAGVVTTFAFDDAGRLTGSDDGTTVRTYEYDGAGRLADATRGTTTWTRSYAPSGRLAGVTTDVGGVTTSSTLTWDVARGIPTVAALTTDGTTSDVFGGVGAAFATTGSASPEAFSRDPLGNLLTTPGTAAVVRGASYGAFGTPDAAGDAPAFGYRGEVHVGDTIDLRARVYDPATQRFLTRDPLDGHPGDPVSTNPYHYATNDPINSADPTGLDPAITDGEWMFAPAVAPIAELSAMDAENLCVEVASEPEQTRWVGGSLGDEGAAACSMLQASQTLRTVTTVAAAAAGVVAGVAVAVSTTGSDDPYRRPDARPSPQPSPSKRPVATRTEGRPSFTLFHYTTTRAMLQIVATQTLLSADEHQTFGPGQYFTDLPPETAALGTREDMSTALFNTAGATHKVEAYVEIDVTGLAIRRVASIYPTRSFARRYGIFRNPTTAPLPLAGRIRRSGRVLYTGR